MSPGAPLKARSRIEVNHLGYGTPKGRPLIKGLSFSLSEGQIGLITGPNGIGKSTLLKTLLGETKKTSGTFKLAVPPQDVSYLPQMQNRAFHIPLLLSDIVAFSDLKKKRPTAAKNSEMFGLLEDHQLALSWNQASGGERQKALLTMTLLRSSPLVFLDEPLNHLDAQGKERLISILKAQVKNHGKTILMVSHGYDLAPALGEYLVELPLEPYLAESYLAEPSASYVLNV